MDGEMKKGQYSLIITYHLLSLHVADDNAVCTLDSEIFLQAKDLQNCFYSLQNGIMKVNYFWNNKKTNSTIWHK